MVKTLRTLNPQKHSLFTGEENTPKKLFTKVKSSMQHSPGNTKNPFLGHSQAHIPNVILPANNT